MKLNLAGPIILPKAGDAQSVLVFLHGYGSDGQDLIGLAPLFADLLPNPVIFSPNAPHRCDINPAGYQWFPVDDLSFRRLVGIEEARTVVHTLLSDLWAETGLGPDRTILAGFSQGGMLALNAGLSLAEPLAAIISFSGGLPPEPSLWPKIAAKPPVLLVHGDSDEVVPPEMSVLARDRLKAEGLEVEHHVSPGCPHGIAPDGIERARRFVAARMPLPKPGS